MAFMGSCWVMVKFPMVQDPHICVVCPQVANMGSPLEDGCRVIIPKTWHVDYSGQCVWGVSRCLHAKHIFFVDFETVTALQPVQKTTFLVSTQLSMLFGWRSKVVDSVDPSLPSFLYSYILLNLFSSWI